MGVPKFFRYISERYPCLSELVRENQVPEFDNLYLDMNGIIHACSHPNDNDIHFRITEEQIFKDIFFYLETLFNMIKPQKLFFLAVDGVAPRAKMNQQRGRRFRSAKEAEVQEQKAKDKGEVLPSEARFDSNCITPGTPFMCRLNTALRYFIQQKISSSKAWRECTVILSGHETPGEGEHKIMEYIRYLKSKKGYDANTRHCLYGLDADLIMLGLCTHERHFSLLREEVKFGKKNNKAVSVSQQRFFLLHLSLMREYLEQEFIALKGNLTFPFDVEKIIDDWVLMGFLVGNDFIPHIPNLHIHSNGLPMLYETYIKTLKTLDGYINEGGYLNLKRLQVFMENLSAFDRDNFTSQYEDLKFLETKHQSGFNQRNDDTFGGNKDLMDLVKATEFEFDSPDEDEENNFKPDVSTDDNLSGDEVFEKEYHQHRRDYYVNKLKYEEMTPEVLVEQAKSYITALQWTLSYYYHGVQSWSWYYPHHYAPFISDLKNFKDFDIKFDVGQPFLPFQQLMSVLPAASRDHVPECYKTLMTSPDSELIDFYPPSFETDLNGKKQEWEAVVLIPFIEEERLLKTLKKYDVKLTPEEKARNVHGPMYAYAYSSTRQGCLDAPCASFPGINNLYCTEKKIYRADIQVPKDQLVSEPLKNALKHVYFAGFPTFKHLNYRSELRLQHVKVFDQPSRGDNMIVIVESEEGKEKKPIELIVKEMMGKVVHVGWPHLMEAKIVRISDKEKTFFSDGNSDKTDPQKWKMDVQSIKEHHIHRMGIDVGDIHILVHVLQATGEEYKFDQKMKMFRATKTWNKIEAAYPLQCIVADIKAYRRKFKEELPMNEAYKAGTQIFMLSKSFYGTMGEIVDANGFEKTGRVKVALTVVTEPNFDFAMDKHDLSQGSYMNSYQAASKLSISDNVFNRITGSVLIIAGLKRQIAEGTSKINIGLQLKFTKQNEELVGYTKRDRCWYYSEKVISLVQEYYCKFPQVFEVLERRSSKENNDVYFESDFFTATDGEDNLHNLSKWLNQLPHQNAERRQVGSDSIEKETIEEITKAVRRTLDLPIKKVTVQAKPHVLYVPSLSKFTTKAADHQANYHIFDRVVVSRDMENFTVGMKGTVIGISKIKDLNPVRQDCVNKEDVYCEILFDGNEQLTGRIAKENLINITYGKSLDGNEDVDQQRGAVKKTNGPVKSASAVKDNMSFSTVLQNPNRAQNAPPQKNQNFVDMWNALKSNPTDVPRETSKAPAAQQTDALNKKMAEVNINTKRSPTPSEQKVPAMITPPTKLPTPPLEWLSNANATPKAKLEMNSVVRPHAQAPNAPVPSRAFHPPGYPHVINPQFPVNRNMPMRPQLMPMMPNQKMVVFPHNVIPPPIFYRGNDPQMFYQNNQQQFAQQRNFNGNPKQNKFNKPPPNMQQQSSQSNAQQNPFIPLQAARKSTKNKDVPNQLSNATKESDDKKEVLPKQSLAEEKASQNDNNATNKLSEAKEASKKTPTATADPRKSRLAIKF